MRSGGCGRRLFAGALGLRRADGQRAPGPTQARPTTQASATTTPARRIVMTSSGQPRVGRLGARSALVRTPLYHDSTHAAAHITTTPATLMTKCIQRRRPPRPARNARQMPEKRRGRRFRPNADCRDHRPQPEPTSVTGQSLGIKRTVTAASARKCANRSTSRSVLLIGYIQRSSQRGHQAGSATARTRSARRRPKTAR